MKRMISILAMLLSLSGVYAQQPASVFLTAGQSNADGRVYNSQAPTYLKGGYKYLHYTNVTSSSDGTFGKRSLANVKERWAFCDVTHYHIEQALQADFYGIKCTYGGTAIDTAATYDHLPVWCADAGWIARNNAYRGDINTGKSLTKSLTEGFGDCVDVTLSKLEQGYDVKAIMWHQGESDRKKAGNYYKNFKDMICYMRNAIYEKTGDESDKTLPFIFGTVSRNSTQYSSGVEAAQKQVAEELPNVYWIDMSNAGLRSDNLHFDSAWTDYLGKQMFNKLVELELVEGKMLDIEKPHIPSVTDSIEVQAERAWYFNKEWSKKSADTLANDEKWPMFQKIGYRYASSINDWWQAATSTGYVFPETEGLYFKCGSSNRLILNPGNHMCLYADNLYMMIPKVRPLQTITIVTASAKGERGITTDSNESLMLVSGGVKSTEKMVNKWQVKDTIEDYADVIFHSNGGAIYVYSIEITDDKEDPTGIRVIRNNRADGRIYNLNGIRVEKPLQGIYICDGRKIVL